MTIEQAKFMEQYINGGLKWKKQTNEQNNLERYM